MGAGVSAGESNDDLIDNLIEANYIKTSSVERVFRAVDRGAYVLADPLTDAYRDVAWKNGNFHISAPCIYSEVLEGLKLKPGMSFLNLGSGTGYLNTMAGLILGSYGINHGIELHENVIRYACQRLDEFKKHSGAIDEYDFCEPRFMQGNCLCLATGYHLYDRVYCGAACPDNYLSYMKNLIKVGGILVVPVNERLLEWRKVNKNIWTKHYLLPVSFTNLVRPEKECQDIVPLFDIEPLSLQELCRTVIRNLLRNVIEVEQPQVKNVRKNTKLTKKKKPMKRDRNDRRDTPKNSEELLDFFLLTIARKKKRVNAATSHEREHSEQSASSSANNDDTGDDNGDTDNPSSDSDDSSLEDPLESSQQTSDEAAACSTPKVETESKVIVHRENEDDNNENVEYNITVEPMPMEGISEMEKPEDRCRVGRTNRAKFNSGLRDELVISELPDIATSSSDDEQISKRCKREKEKRLGSKWRKVDRVEASKKCSDSDSDDYEVGSDSEWGEHGGNNRKKMYRSPYTIHMKNKIQQLPLPSNMKKFLNFYREF